MVLLEPLLYLLGPSASLPLPRHSLWAEPKQVSKLLTLSDLERKLGDPMPPSTSELLSLNSKE